MTKILSVDVDDCIVEMIPDWLQWCNFQTGKNLKLSEIGYPYDLSPFFPEIRAMTFWENNQLYHTRQPLQEAVECLGKLHSKGWKIGFASFCKKDHFSSKCKMINKYFPYRSFIMATKEKGFVRCTHAVDDSLDNCEAYLEQGVKTILLLLPHRKVDRKVDSRILVAYSWDDVFSLLQEEE